MLLKIAELYGLYNCIEQMKQIKGARFEFNFLLIEIKKKIKQYVLDAEEKKKILREEKKELVVKHCKKDTEGNAEVIYTDNAAIHKGLAIGECPEYDARVKEINEQIKSIDDNEIEVDLDEIKKIKKDQCPKAEMTGEHWEALENWIENFQQ